MTLALTAGAFLLGAVTGDRLRPRTSQWALAWRTFQGPIPHQGYKSQGKITGSEAGVTAEQRRQIEKLRSMAYATGNAPVPESVGVTAHLEELAQPGLNLIVDTHGPEAVLTDMAGRVVHSWRHEFQAAFPSSRIHRGAEGIQYWRRVALLDGGGLLAIFEGAGLVRLDRDSELVWAFDEAVHHDLEVQADGRIFVLTREAGMRPRIHPERPVTEDWIVILSPAGEVLRRVSILEAIRGSDFSSLLTLGEGHGDLLHTNTVEVLDGRLADRLPAFAPGNVLLSFPKIDTIAVLDMDREAIVWSMTGMTSYQHDPTVLDNRRLLVFDNWVLEAWRVDGRLPDGGEAGSPAGQRYSRVVEIDPVSRRVEWSYDGRRHGFFTECCGASRRLANGNTLITETDRGRAFEVTPDGTLVWEFLTPHRAREDGEELVARLFEVQRIAPEAVAGWL